jgi:hypothetical protein
MKDGAWRRTRWHLAALGVFDAPKRRRWRSSDIKSFLPLSRVRPLELAMQSIAERGNWLQIDEEAWWADVLDDPRVRPPLRKTLPAGHRYAHLRLDRCQAESVTFVCVSCRQQTTLDVAVLRERFGRDRNILTIRGEALLCGKHKRDRRDGYECDVSYRLNSPK